jgi:ABC-type transport system substrate-binding protein
MLTEWLAGDHETYVRNPNYWEKGRPYLDGMTHKFILDDTARYNTLKTTPGSIDIQKDPVLVPQATSDGYPVIQLGANGGGWALQFNTTTPPFNDVRVRQAVELAIDNAQFNQIRRSGDKKLMFGTLDAPGTPFYDQSITVPKVNLAAAQKLVDAVVAQTGKPIQFTILTYTSAYILNDVTALQAQISKLKNVSVALDVEQSTAVQKAFALGQFQAFPITVRWNEPAVDMVNSFLSTGPTNYGHYNNSTVDTALNQLKTATDQKTRVQLVHSVEQQVLKDVPDAFYTRFPSITIPDKTIKGLTMYYPQNFLSDQIWISGTH